MILEEWDKSFETAIVESFKKLLIANDEENIDPLNSGSVLISM